MSQYYRRVDGGSPSVPTSFTTDDGTGIPAANNLNLLARDTTENDIDGIRSKADPNNGDNVYIELTNRLQGSGTAIGAATADLITFDLGASAAVYRFTFIVAGRDTGTGEGATYNVLGAMRTDGVTATEISIDIDNEAEDAALVDAEIDLLASGNNAVLRVTGVAGQNISFQAVGSYVVV